MKLELKHLLEGTARKGLCEMSVCFTIQDYMRYMRVVRVVTINLYVH